MPKLSQLKHYRDFINERDKALEVIHRRTLKETSDLARSTLLSILHRISVTYHGINEHTRFTNRGRALIDSCYQDMDHQFRILSWQMAVPIERMQRAVTLLSYAGELEAIARVQGKNHQARVPQVLPSHAQEKCYAALTKLLGKIRSQIEMGYVFEENTSEILARVQKQFPKVKRFKVPPRELKPLKEASKEEWASSATVDFMPDEDWRTIVSLYKDEYIPKNRDLTFDVDVGEPELEEWYGWEIEQTITDDFVSRVRDGSVQAATEAGIDDFMWTAILDDRTREEHRLKDGLTSSEIEAKLEDEWSDFDDDSIVAPGGERCRCRSVPYVSDLPENPKANYGDFEEWLND